jgi:hypothetical protein
LQAAYDHVPKLPGLRPHAPDDFAFASRERLEHVLNEAGLRRIRLERCDLMLDMSGGQGGEQGLDSAVANAFAMGPAARAVGGQPAEAVMAAAEAVSKVLSRYAGDGNAVMVPASAWIVTAVDP